jgi:phytoene dehydrogenase-like protein
MEDEYRERRYHRDRQQAGLPPVNSALVLNLTIRDVTDDEAEHIRLTISEAATMIAEACPTDRNSRMPSYAGDSSTVVTEG